MRLVMFEVIKLEDIKVESIRKQVEYELNKNAE